MLSPLFLGVVAIGLLGATVVGVVLLKRDREAETVWGPFDLTFWPALIYVLLAMVGYGLGAILFLPLLVIAAIHGWSAISRWRRGTRPRPLTIAGIALTGLSVLLVALVLWDVIINVIGSGFRQ